MSLRKEVFEISDRETDIQSPQSYEATQENEARPDFVCSNTGIISRMNARLILQYLLKSIVFEN